MTTDPELSFSTFKERAEKARKTQPMTTQPPDGLTPSRQSPVFTEDTLPTALQAEHTLAAGHWGVLNVLEGSLRFDEPRHG